jgi:hypothetical protein
MTVRNLDRFVKAFGGLDAAVEVAIKGGALGPFARDPDPRRKERLLLEWVSDAQALEMWKDHLKAGPFPTS